MSEEKALPEQPVAPPPARPVVPQQPPVEIDFQTGLPKQPTATPAGQPGDQGQPTTPTSQPAQEPAATKTFTQEDLDRLAAKIRKETKEQAAREREQEVENAKLSTQERLQKEQAELKAQLDKAQRDLKNQTINNAILAVAATRGLDGTAAIKLVDLDKVELDESGAVTNAVALVDAVIAQYPGLVRKTTPAIPVSNPNSSPNQQGRTDEDRRRDYFGAGQNAWAGGGVQWVQELPPV